MKSLLHWNNLYLVALHKKKSFDKFPRRLANGLGAFTRHPEGQIGQPFYGWFTDGDNLLQAASAAYSAKG